MDDVREKASERPEAIAKRKGNVSETLRTDGREATKRSAEKGSEMKRQ
jgi:hypothetical protein